MTKRSEKKELMKIVDEIDNILFGCRVYKSYRRPEFQDIAYGLIFAMSGVVLSALYSEDNINIADIFIGALLGIYSGGFWNAARVMEYTKDYEKAYLKLDRKKQIEVLLLAKKLSLAIEKEIKYKSNKKYFDPYLGNKNNLNFFERMDRYIPHFEILSEEKIKEIHNNGNLTPEEIFEEWMKLDYCIYSKSKCDKYDSCRACLIDCANQREEWPCLETATILENVTQLDDVEKGKSYTKERKK